MQAASEAVRIKSERLINEGLIDMDHAAEIAGVSQDSIWRWITRGRSGTKLESVKFVSGKYRTSKMALARFAATMAACEQTPQACNSRSGQARSEPRNQS